MDMNLFHHRVTRSSTEFKSLLKRRINADFRKGKLKMYDKELQSFNLRSSVLIRVLSDKYYSVELCATLW